MMFRTMPHVRMRRAILWTLLGLNLAVWFIFLLRPRWTVLAPQQSPLADYGRVRPFILTERSDTRFSLEDLKGSPWVASFMFTQCSGQCPSMNLKVSRLQKLLPANVRLVSFSVDPAHDTPKTLAEYAASYGAARDRWLFLTGQKEAVQRVLSDFHLPGGDDPNLHSLRLMLVDAKSKIRGYYDSLDEASLQKLIRDARLLARGQE